MKTVSITEAKNRLSALIDRVKNGESIVIAERGIPVARLEPAVSLDEPDESRLARLERKGIVRRGSGKPPLDLLSKPPPRLRGGGSVVEDLIRERREGR